MYFQEISFITCELLSVLLLGMMRVELQNLPFSSPSITTRLAELIIDFLVLVSYRYMLQYMQLYFLNTEHAATKGYWRRINKGETKYAKAKALSRVLALLMSIIVPTLSRYEVLPKAAVLEQLDSICH